MSILTISEEKIETLNIIRLDGLLNADSSPQLEDKLITLTELEQPKILMDMEKLTYISSAGIGCFIGVIKRIRNKEGDLRFACLDTKVKRVFVLLDMEDFFKFFSSVEEGIDSFK